METVPTKETIKDIVEQTSSLSVMDEESNKALDHLAGVLTVKDMAHFQPIVELTKGVADILNIKYDPENESTIQAYKDGKRVYGAFNTKLREAKGKLKEPYTQTTKAIDTVFKKFSELYDLSKNHLAEEFKPHLELEKQKKEEREKKKNEAREKEMAELKEQNNEILRKNANTSTFNTIRYEVISAFKEKAIQDLNGLNTTTIQNRIDKIEGSDMATLLFESDKDVLMADFDKLEASQKSQLEDVLLKDKLSIVESYKTRLKELVELENMRAQQNNSTDPEPTQSFIPPVPPALTQEQSISKDEGFDSSNFIDRKFDQILEIRDECDFYYELENVEQRGLAKNISIMLTRAIDFINEQKQ